MNLPPEKKPSLSDLFISKKLDVPNDEFWDCFQDQVRCKTLSSVVTDNNQSRVFKYISYTTALFVFTLFSYWALFPASSTLVTIAENSGDLNSMSLISPDSISTKSSSPSDLDPSIEYEILLAESEDFFVEQNYFASSLESSFQHRILENDHDVFDELMLEFTF
jgi:hypothetical protein